ncbi:CRE-STR-148 protein [Caenorhabditis remanei]|uniref:Serpentine receptor class r-10 n=1 Tax=Caenorhabditis remanei TaxID=31234 RepID=E3LZI0_CAERE|nr:CRE-STR-148 protein [Caenorhabditis remanei]
MLWLHIVQYSGFFLAQITNSALVYLILTKAEKLFGTYRHVMCTFAMYSLIYAWIEVLTQPVMHIKGPCFIVFMDSPLKYHSWIGNMITCLYCGSFALVISLLAAQFFYRYVAMCRPELLAKIEGFKLTYIFIPCIVCFVLWFEFVYYGMANTVEKQIYMKEELENYYEEDSERVAFIAPMYWSIGKNGEKIWKFGEIMGSTGCVCIIAVCFSTIVICATNIYLTMKSVNCHMSARTLELNHQLFLTLTFQVVVDFEDRIHFKDFQTLLPFIMMYSPVGLLITLPLFEVYVGSIANFVPASLAVYPSLEPLIAMICIKDFRKTILCSSWRKISPRVTAYITSSGAIL